MSFPIPSFIPSETSTPFLALLFLWLKDLLLVPPFLFVSVSSFHLHFPLIRRPLILCQPLENVVLLSLFLRRDSLMSFSCSMPISLWLGVRFPPFLIVFSLSARRWFPPCVRCLVLLLCIGVDNSPLLFKCFLCTFFGFPSTLLTLRVLICLTSPFPWPLISISSVLEGH